jgi:NADH-quinone oxidoreductase subunit L
MEYSLRLIPLLPFAGAAFLFLFGRAIRRDYAHIIATTAIAGSCLAALYAFFGALPEAREAGGLHDQVWTWLTSDTLKIDLAFRMDALSGVMCLIITFIGTLIHVYSIGYMSHEQDYARFFSYLNLFCGAMLVLVLGDSLPVLFIGWEGVGLCSYLLIGFWYQDKANADAGKKAFITNRIGDFGFLMGMFLLFEATGSLSIPDILAAAHARSPDLLMTIYSQPKAFWAALFLFIGATGKSAQIPLYVWLPDAMAGPTPVSALIHAATMVTAGVYMVARMGALYLLSPFAMAIVALVGALTALFAAIIGFAQNDFKKVLAYSTVSQLGFMFVGVGTGAFGSGIFHLLTHAFFKAGLFLCAGSVMHAMSGSGDITKMGGLRKLVPWTHGVFLVCWLAIIGAPLFSGFFSKDAIIASALGTDVYGPGLAWVGPLCAVMLFAAALGTAFYMSRLYFLVFTGPCRADEQTKHHIHESPSEMVVPLVVLAVGAALSGFLGFPGGLFEGTGLHIPNVLAEWLEPSVGHELHVSHTVEGGAMGASTVMAVAGAWLAWIFFGGGYRQPVKNFAASVPGLVALVRDKFRIDELYDRLIIRPVRWLARGLYIVVDRYIIDRGLVNLPVTVVDLLGRLSRTFQPGDAQRYVAVFAIGIAGVFYVITRPPRPEELKVKVDALAVDADASSASQGHDLMYSFDFDGDGRADRQGPSPTAHFSYEGSGTYNITVQIRDPKWGTVRNVTKKVTVNTR